ncbi:MAG: enoyl-CoA hydratase-related protein [Bauldia litoralis]
MARDSFETLLLEDKGDGVFLLSLNRPQVLNAISTQMVRELREFFIPLAYGSPDYRCLVLAGAGERAFCSGGDLKERDGMSDEKLRAQHALIEEYAFAMANCIVPMIAAVRGPAFAGGCELALSCDFIYASTDAKFALTEVTRGIMPGAGGTQNLAAAVGERRAKEIILTGKPFGAEQAYEWGLVNALLPPEGVVDAALETARTIALNAPIAVRQAKKAIHYGQQTDLRTGLMLEAQIYDRMISTDDRYEGIRAFNEKRPPRFSGK